MFSTPSNEFLFNFNEGPQVSGLPSSPGPSFHPEMTASMLRPVELPLPPWREHPTSAPVPFSQLREEQVPFNQQPPEETGLRWLRVLGVPQVFERYTRADRPAGTQAGSSGPPPVQQIRVSLSVSLCLYDGSDTIQKRSDDYLELEVGQLSCTYKIYGDDSLTLRWALDCAVQTLVIYDCFRVSSFNALLCRDPSVPRKPRPDVQLSLQCHSRPDLPHFLEHTLSLRTAALSCNIDQAVLDFLGQFFSFQAPLSPEMAAESAAGGPVVYFRHAYINPIRISLHYKPRQSQYSLNPRAMMSLMEIADLRFSIPKLSLRGVDGWAHLWAAQQKNASEALFGANNSLMTAFSQLAYAKKLKPLVNLSKGVADLVRKPLQGGDKEGVMFGMVQGAHSFATSVAKEGLNLSTKVASGAKNALQTVDSSLSPAVQSHAADKATDKPAAPSAAAGTVGGGGVGGGIGGAAGARPTRRPRNINEGLHQSIQSLQTEYHRTKDLAAIPGQVYETQGLVGAVGSAAVAAPLSLIRPLIGLTRGATRILIGLKSSTFPDSVTINQTKYKHPQQ